MPRPGFVRVNRVGEIKDPISMIHCNKHAICAIAIETNGKRPFYHSMFEICVMPLTPELKPNRTIYPFYTSWCPAHKERADYPNMRLKRERYAQSCTGALDYMSSADLFQEWFENKLKLEPTKKIMPLVHNWQSIYPFLLGWLGHENYFNMFHDLQIRDLVAAVLLENDKADHQAEQTPFPKPFLQYVATTLRIERTHPHSTIQDCAVTAECYRRILKDGFSVLKVVEEANPVFDRVELPFTKEEIDAVPSDDEDELDDFARAVGGGVCDVPSVQPQGSGSDGDADGSAGDVGLAEVPYGMQQLW